MSSHQYVLDCLFESIQKWDGKEKLEQLKPSFKEECHGAVCREIIVQIISREPFWTRIGFLALYPKYILPYLTRIRT